MKRNPPYSINLEISGRFKSLRKNANFSQKVLGRLIGICRQSVCKIEAGIVKPRESTLKKFIDLEQKHLCPIILMEGFWDEA